MVTPARRAPDHRSAAPAASAVAPARPCAAVTHDRATLARHGRIGGRHPRVFLRSVFPADRLDALLALESRIRRKLTGAARSIGVATSPLDGADPGDQVFAETRAEIERLAAEDPSLFQHGGPAAAAQTGEEYRHRLRRALATDRAAITGLPGAAGSGLRRGPRSGVVFCAEVELTTGRRTFLRFVPALPGWHPAPPSEVRREIGTCLRLIACTEATPRVLPPALRDGIFAFWHVALDDLLAEWDDLSDPVNLQPRVAALNRAVAAHLRTHPPHDLPPARLAEALDILEAPWPYRETAGLRARFADRTGPATARSRALVDWILATGLERYEPPRPLPAITPADIYLACWMAIEAPP